jgi:hypothetical protein
MPDRIVRDELLTSERYWSVSMQAQQLYVHLLLVVDDAARFSGKNFTLRASCFPGRPIEANTMEKMLAELVDVDLIRLYEVGAERYVFVPRFRNRKRYVSSSNYPAPPNEINDLGLTKSSLSRPQVSPKSAPSQEGRGSGGVGVGVGEGKIQEATPLVDLPTATRRPQCPTQEILDLYHKHLPMLPAVEVMSESRKRALSARWREVVTDHEIASTDDPRVAALDWWAWYFGHAARSKFLTGKVKDWRADFDFLITPSKFAKVVEGAYHKEHA